MIVCKFGGTSVGDAAAFGRLVEIVRRRRPQQPVVVVSALAGVTDALLTLPALEPACRSMALSALLDRHAGIVTGLGLDPAALDPIREEAGLLAGRLEALGSAAPDDAFLDSVAMHGELWSSRLVAAALEQAGVPVAWVDIRPVIRTDARFTRAVPDREGLPARARTAFTESADGRVPVTQGFLGSTEDGRPTTLGRGGSDYTATLLGAALGVERVEIWTDVDGIMTADPRLVPNARLLPVASHLEAAELAAFGAKVLHPATQAPLVEALIPCVVLNSFAPDGPGTSIVTGVHPEPVGSSPVRAISWKRGVTVLNIRSPRMLGATGFLRRVFEVFERNGVSVDVLATSEVSLSLTVDDPVPLDALFRDLGSLGEVTAFPGRAIVAVIGIDLRETSGLAARIFDAVRDINVEVISQGASAINVTFVVREADGAEAVRRLHHEFFGAGEAG